MLLIGLMVGATVGAYLTFAWLLFRRPPTEAGWESKYKSWLSVYDAWLKKPNEERREPPLPNENVGSAVRLLRKVSERRRREAEKERDWQDMITNLMYRDRAKRQR